MEIGVNPAELLEVSESIFAYLTLGLVMSAAFTPLFPIVNRVNQLLGGESVSTDHFQTLWDDVFDFFFGAILPHQQTPDRTSKWRLVESHAALGVLVVAMAIVLEIAFAFGVVGIAFASYHLAGFTIDISTVYTDIVAIIVLLTLCVMSYGECKIKQTAQYV